MNTSNQTYKELAIPYFKEVFDIIDEVMTLKETPYYLIGASAMALELLKSGIDPGRATKDIDFAIMVSSIQQYEEIIEELEKRGFNKVKAPWTVYSEEYNVVIDILPFGEIEQNDRVQFNELYSDLHVLGFNEVLVNSVKVSIEEKIALVPPLPGMILLKLVAWSDRPEERDNDLSDILKIIDHYFDHEWEEIVTNHYDTFPEDELDQLKIAARVLGRKAKEFLEQSKALKDRILKVLGENLIEVETSAIAKEWARLHDSDVSYAHSILNEFKIGITE